MYYQTNSDGSPNEGAVHMSQAMVDQAPTIAAASIAQYASPLLSIGSTIYQGEVQKSINRDQIAHNMQMYNLSREDAIKMWEMQNEYNLPTSQMQRLRDAGLNPHLVYGKGADVTAEKPSSPQANPAKLTAPNYSGLGNSIAEYVNLQAIQAQTRRTEAETKRIQEETEAGRFRNAVNSMYGVDNTVQDRIREYAAKNAGFAKDYRDLQTYLEVAYSGSNSDTFVADPWGGYQRPDGNTPIVGKITADLESSDFVNKAKQAGIDKLAADIKSIEARIELYGQQKALNEIDIKIKDFQRNLRELGVSPETIQGIAIFTSVINTLLRR